MQRLDAAVPFVRTKFPRFVFGLLPALFLFIGSTETARSQATAASDGRVSIWKVSDADSTVYLAGSVHLLRRVDLPIPDAYEKVYSDCAEVIFEVDMSVVDQPDMQEKYQQLGMLPAGDSLDRHLSGETVRKVRNFLLNLGMPPRSLDKYKPGMVYLGLASLLARKVGAIPELGLETTIFEKCKKDGKPSKGLETVEFQITRFDEMSREELEEILIATVEEAEDTEKTLSDMVRVWKHGEAEKLNAMISEHMKVGSSVRRLLLTERNANWVSDVEKALAGPKNVMFLVGAAHLVGNDSLVEMLKQRGHTVTQLKAASAGSVLQ